MSGNSSVTARAEWRSPIVVIVAACLIAMVGFGLRSTFGLFLEPMTAARGWSRETFALALAIQNLMWGIGVPIAGAIADRYGASRVILVGTLFYGCGIYGMSVAETGSALHLTAGILTGIGVAFYRLFSGNGGNGKGRCQLTKDLLFLAWEQRQAHAVRSCFHR